MFRRNKDNTTDISSLPVFEGLGDAELKRVAELGELATYEPGSVVIEEGGFSHQFFVVVDGSVDVTHEGDTLAKLSAGSPLGEAALLDWWTPPKDQRANFDSGRRTATVLASDEEGAKLLVFEQRAFENLRKEAPTTALRLIDAVRDRTRVDRSS